MATNMLSHDDVPKGHCSLKLISNAAGDLSYCQFLITAIHVLLMNGFVTLVILVPGP